MIQEGQSVIETLSALREQASASGDPAFLAAADTAFNGVMVMIATLVAFSMCPDDRVAEITQKALGAAGICAEQVVAFQQILDERIKESAEGHR